MAQVLLAVKFCWAGSASKSSQGHITSREFQGNRGPALPISQEPELGGGAAAAADLCCPSFLVLCCSR
jgi:hypothetical protein